jgi:hypothetical protein
MNAFRVTLVLAPSPHAICAPVAFGRNATRLQPREETAKGPVLACDDAARGGLSGFGGPLELDLAQPARVRLGPDYLIGRKLAAHDITQ